MKNGLNNYSSALNKSTFLSTFLKGKNIFGVRLSHYKSCLRNITKAMSVIVHESFNHNRHFDCISLRFLVLCILAPSWLTLILNGTEPLLILLVTPVFFMLCSAKMSAVTKLHSSK